MGYIIGLLCLIIAYGVRVAYKNIHNPICIFALIWGIVCIFSQMKLYGFTGTDIYGYMVIGIGILSFSVGAILLLNKRRTLSFVLFRHEKRVASEIVNTKLLWVLLIVVFLYTLSKFLLALPYIRMNNTLGYVRTIYLKVGAGITINALDYFINTFIITGFRLTCEIVLINEMISRRAVKKLMFVVLVLIIAMNVLLSGGRMILFDLVTYVIFSVLLNGFGTKFKLSWKQKVLFFVVGIVIVYAMIYITKDRQSNITVLESVYGNFVGGVSLYNTIINNVIGNNWTYGTMFTYAVLSVVWLPLNYIFKIPYPKTFETFDLLVSPFYDVGATTMNAYTTCWTFFYADFRIPGVIILSAVFGMIAANSYIRYETSRRAVNTCKYMLMLNVLVYSIIRWQLCNTSYLLVLIMISYVYKREVMSVDSSSELNF